MVATECNVATHPSPSSPIPTPHLIIRCVLNSLPHSLLTASPPPSLSATPPFSLSSSLFSLSSSLFSLSSSLSSSLSPPSLLPLSPLRPSFEMPSAVRTRDSDPFRSSDPYAGDNFRMYEFKVRRCVRGRTHDWTDCPFAHPGEKACRRDPRRFHYSGNACPDFRRGACRRGDACELAHGVFESWLHPARYRTQTCRDGRSCRRKVCFFAHTPSQLRVLPSPTSPPTGSSSSSPASGKQRILICSCAFCPCKSPVSSPNSTLNMGLSHFSPPLSPPLSPVYSPSLDCNSAYRNVFNYKSLLTELVNSLETMDLSSVVSPSASSTATVDAFLLSPASSVSRDYSTNYQEKDDINAEESSFSNNINGCPDLDWVNELVM